MTVIKLFSARTFSIAMGLSFLIINTAYAVVRLQDNPGFLVPPPQTQTFANPAIKPTEIINNVSATDNTIIDGIEIINNSHTRDWVIKRNLKALINNGEKLDLKRLEDTFKISNQFHTYHIDKAVVSDKDEANNKVILTLYISEKQPWNFSATFDNQGRPDVGLYRGGLGVTNQNVTGLGDRLSVVYLQAKGTYATINSYSIPLNGWGDELTFGLTANKVNQVLPNVITQPDIGGYSHVFNVTLSHPFDRHRWLTGTLNYNYRLNDSYINGIKDTAARTNFTVAGLTFNRADKLGSTYARVETAYGVFNKTQFRGIWRSTAILNRMFTLPARNQLILRGFGQITSDTIPIAQDLQLGGAYSVRGYTEGLLDGDRGYFLSIEDRFPLPYLSRMSPWLDRRLRGAVFAELGQSFTNKSSPRYIGGVSSHFDHTFLASSGVGLRYALSHLLTGFVDVGFGLSNRAAVESHGQPTARIHFGIRTDLF